MMVVNVERKVLLLLPALETYADNPETIEKIRQLRCDCNLVVKQVSKTINRLIQTTEVDRLDDFLIRFGLPDISLSIADCNQDDNHSGIRICLTRFNDLDFSNNFTMHKTEFERNDISHLIELRIKDKQSTPKWFPSDYKDTDGKQIFDVAVTADIKCLFNVILSFMVDIYAYYIIGLSKEFSFRANFSQKKIEFLNNNFGGSIKTAYNLDRNSKQISSNIHYLPLSFRHQPDATDLKLAETIKDYYQVVVDFIINENTYEWVSDKIVYNLIYTLGNNQDIINQAKADIERKYPGEKNKYIAVYTPPLKDLNIEDDDNQQLRLKNDIKARLKSVQEINTVSFGEQRDGLYVLIPEKIPETIIPLFSCFEWVILKTDRS